MKTENMGGVKTSQNNNIMKQPKIKFILEPKLEWLGTDEVSINELVSIQYDDYEIDFRLTGERRVKEHKGDYDNPHEFEIINKDINCQILASYDREGKIATFSYDDFVKIKKDITNFIEPLL